MADPLLDLNAEQRAAVEMTEGSLLVLAGAGTGKTRVVTARLAHLIRRGEAPENLLALTFTNKAAREMRERVGALVGQRSSVRLFAGTFHAFCLRLLREHGTAGGLEKFSICDAADQLALAKSALRELRVADATLAPAQLLSRISLAKSRLVSSDTLLANARDDVEELAGRAFARYEAELNRSRLLDFDDLLLRALALLAPNTRARDVCRKTYRYVHVDEYQDTNEPQYEILRAIAGGHRNLCAVGDDDQAIYGWRGANVERILRFELDFKPATVLRLETNYRSSEQILSLANRVIACNPKRHPKTLRSTLGTGPPVRALCLSDEVEEADFVAREILERTRRAPSGSAQAGFGDFAVLVRTGSQPRVFESQFRARGVPYVVVGGMSFFDRKEVRDVLAYLRLVINPNDEVALLRIVNAPPRGVGRATIERILSLATERGVSACEVLDASDSIPGVPAAALEAARGLRRALASVANLRERPLSAQIRALIDVVGYRTEVERCYRDPATFEQRWSGVLEILNLAENFARSNRGSTLEDLVSSLALESEERAEESSPGRDAVTLSTLHAAKGLEYPRVYLVGLEEGLLPHARALAEDGVEEERRLTYVGLTRARNELTLTYTATRAQHGQRVESMPSRFLFEMKGEAPPKGWRAANAPPDGSKKSRGGGRGGRRRAGASRKAR